MPKARADKLDERRSNFADRKQGFKRGFGRTYTHKPTQGKRHLVRIAMGAIHHKLDPCFGFLQLRFILGNVFSRKVRA